MAIQRNQMLNYYIITINYINKQIKKQKILKKVYSMKNIFILKTIEDKFYQNLMILINNKNNITNNGLISIINLKYLKLLKQIMIYIEIS